MAKIEFAGMILAALNHGATIDSPDFENLIDRINKAASDVIVCRYYSQPQSDCAEQTNRLLLLERMRDGK